MRVPDDNERRSQIRRQHIDTLIREARAVADEANGEFSLDAILIALALGNVTNQLVYIAKDLQEANDIRQQP